MFDDSDVVRHHLVQRIVRAYDEHKTRVDSQLSLTLELGTTERAASGGSSFLELGRCGLSTTLGMWHQRPGAHPPGA